MQPSFTVSELRGSNVLHAAECVSTVFANREPLCAALSITREQMMSFCVPYFCHVMEHKLSLVASDVHTGKVVGAVIVEDPILNQKNPPDLASMDVVILPILEILETVSASFYKAGTHSVGSVAQILMIAVTDGYQNKGIIQELHKRLIEQLPGRGYTSLVTEPTGPISRHVFQKLGFEPYDSIVCSGFSFENRYPFANMDQGELVHCMTRELR